MLWGVFATPGDKSRSGETVVATPGALRFLLELAVFFGGAVALYAAGSHVLAITLAGVLIVYHALSWDRVVWLLRYKCPFSSIVSGSHVGELRTDSCLETRRASNPAGDQWAWASRGRCLNGLVSSGERRPGK
ncbi:DUF2568 domain-containing protein [Streptomyces sp. NPDC005480]|uniref:DUF2568 domain-containing protein n=1 Tax=Streptomyces sp. NPDC005480 TaxID=3154880 RepID=UPI0033B84CF1